MSTISVASLEALNQAGVLKFTNKTLMVADGDADPLTTPFDSSAALQAFPDGYYSGGSITTDGVVVSTDMSSDATNIDQAVAATRNDVTSDTLGVKVAFAETTNKVVMALANNLKIADITMTPFLHATRPASGIQPKRRLIMVSEDTLRNVILVQFWGTATVTAKDDLTLARSTATSWGCTLSPVPDPDILDADGNPTDQDFWLGGSGWADLVGTTTPAWAATTAYSVNDLVTLSGDVLKCTTAGTSGSSAPTPPASVGGTVTDGTVTWTRTA